MSHKIQAVIWDMDGVVLDSAEEHRLSWHKMAQDEKLPFTDQQFWDTFGMRNNAIITQLWGEMADERLQALADKKEEYFRKEIRETATALPGALELMRALHEAGYAQALASSAPLKNIQVVNEVLGLDRYLSKLISGETVPHGKPFPDVFLKAANELGVTPEHCLVIEDAVVGVEAAHRGGMQAIAVAGTRDLPGLRKAELQVHDLTQVSVQTIEELA